MVQAGGLEPPAYFLGGSRSILMSYACTKNLLNPFYEACQSILIFRNKTLFANVVKISCKRQALPV